MKTNQLLNELAIRLGIKKIILFLLALSIVCNFLLVVMLFTRKTIVETILTPPEIRRSMTISNVAFSKEYLEEIAPYNAYLLLNATPQNVDFQSQQLLKFVASEYKDALEKELNINALWLKQNNISTSFTAMNAAADINDNTVVLRGSFEVIKNNKIVDQRDRELLLSYRNENGTIQLISIKEVIPDEKQRPEDAEAQKKYDLNNPAPKEVKVEETETTQTITNFKGGSNE